MYEHFDVYAALFISLIISNVNEEIGSQKKSLFILRILKLSGKTLLDETVWSLLGVGLWVSCL